MHVYMCVRVCVLAGGVRWRRHVCFLPERPLLRVCMCVRMYMNELVALQFPGSQGAAFSERHCMFTVLMHIHTEEHTLTYSPTQRGLSGWKPSSFSVKKKTKKNVAVLSSLC